MAEKQDRLNERLIDASMNGRLHRVVEALEEGADLEARDSNGKTALMRAAFYGKVRVVNKLLQAGADPNARAAERHGDRPGREDGTTALMQVADGVFIGNHDEVIRALVEGGADVNLQDSRGQTALMWACERTPLAAKTLLELGAKVDLRDSHGETALMKAAKHADHPFFRQACAEIIALLKQHGATEEGLDVVDLLKAVEKGDVARVRALLASGVDVNAPTERGTALTRAARRGHLEIVEALLAAEADPKASHSEWSTPIVNAVMSGNLDVVKRLLDAGAEVDADLPQMRLAVDHAKESGHAEVVEHLRSLGITGTDVATLRGVATSDVNETAILVKSPVERVAEALCELTGAAEWQQDAHGKEVILSKQCYAVVQFRGHPWTLIEPLNETLEDPSPLKPELASNLSRELETESLHYANSDTAGCVGYELFSHGELIEDLYSGPGEFTAAELDAGGEEEPDDACYGQEGLRFKSTRRSVEPESIPNVYDFVDATFRELDAYVPGWSAGWAEPGARTVLLPRWTRDDVVRTDFISVAPVPEQKTPAEHKELEPQLFAAIKAQDVERVRELIGAGVDVNAKRAGRSALELAFYGSPSAGGLLKGLAAMFGAGDEDSTTEEAGPKAPAARLLEGLASAFGAGEEQAESGRSEPERPDSRCACALIEAGADVALGDKSKSLITEAAYRGAVEVIRALLEAGSDLDLRGTVSKTAMVDSSNQLGLAGAFSIQSETTELYTNATALIVAAGEGHLDVVRVLVDAGARLNEVDDACRTALAVAEDRGHDAIAALLKEAGATRTPDDLSPELRLLHAAETGDLETARALIEQGVDVNCRDQRKDTRGQTPLMLAAAGDHAETVRRLVEAGADPNARDDESPEKPPWASFVLNEGGPEALLEAGELLGRNALMFAADNGAARAMAALVEAGADVNAVSKYKEYPLLLAVEGGHADVVKTLVAAGADVNVRGSDRATALMEAIQFEHPEIARVLIDAKAKLDLKDGDGHTPLMVAIEHNLTDTAKRLIEAGAKLSVKDRQGRTALEWAEESSVRRATRQLVSDAYAAQEKKPKKR